jgi:LDH2 family malate/lactate/ureidoglycolate dehydrogenase
MTDTETVAVGELKALADAALARAGLLEADRAAVTRVLVEADMMGLSTHGVTRLENYVERVRIGGVAARAEVTVERKGPSLALVDGGNALGPVVGERALAAAMEIAGETGLAHVGCRNSNHFGALAPYALTACEAGFVSVMATNATTTMPPWGGAKARIGNNPFGVAAPCPEPPHFILDMAMSVAARGKIRAARDAGKPIPEGWAVDANGRTTTDPAAALAGFLMPVGGHKGSGLSQAVDVLAGVLSGAQFLTGVSSWLDDPERPQGLGHFMLLIDPARLIGRLAFDHAMGRFQRIIRETPPANPDRPVLLPGEREQASRERALSEGVAVPGKVLATLRRLAG